MPNSPRALGWLKPEPKHLARLKLAKAEARSSILDGIVAAPTSDNYKLCRPIDQKSLGSCSTNMVTQVIRGARVKSGEVDPPFTSRLALYYWARYQDGNQLVDSGTYNATSFDMAAGMGLPPEECWPYEIDHFKIKPGPEVDRVAYDSRGKIGVNYHPISTLGDYFIEDMEKALTAGYLVGFGVFVSVAFCSQDPHGTIEPPKPGERAGGHAMTAIGHDRARQRVLVLNSWGADWCDETTYPGCCWLSYEYLRQSDDRWIAKLVPGGGQ